ncbi:oxidoreductase swnN [Colletotrichum liriopes]|uniref:Oxidoreductase swnN n=1 Tax=Colletotrichum liriopes TaxID=708192 RepID=A0AA37GSV2_9PEZI|nr:oxidoreductase swnN [Colletotrichum liriopes]
MAIIAVAGGSGSVGRTIVDGLVAHGGHNVFVLSRTKREPQNGVHYVAVNYGDVDETSKVLEENQIDTVISAMGVVTPSTNKAQINLVKAAQRSSSTRRFVYAFEAIDELEQTNLEYTRVVNGFFLDYYGMPHYNTHLQPWINFINLEKKWAVIPGDGSAKANFITSQDMAKYIARLMDLRNWSKVSSIVAETLSISELLALAEETRGSRFRVAHDELETLKSGRISFASEFPEFDLSREESEALFAKVHYYAGIGRFLVPAEDTLNSKFPDIIPKTAAQVIKESWEGN